MAIQQKLHTKLVQKLILTPSLQQAIKLLPMSTLELADLLNQEVVENPMLEEVPTEDLQPTEAAAQAEKAEAETKEKGDAWDDSDYEYFFGDYLDDGPALLRRVAQDIAPEEICGEWIGLARFSARGAEWLREEIEAMEAEGLLEAADLPLLLTRLAAKHPVRVKYFTGHWLDVDTLTDLAEARNFS